MLGRLLPRCAATAAQRTVLRSAALRSSGGAARSLHCIGEVEGVHPPLAEYSHGVLVGPGCKTVYLSGQVGIDAEGNVPEGAAAQAELAFGAVELLLADVGMTAKDGALLCAPRHAMPSCGAPCALCCCLSLASCR